MTSSAPAADARTGGYARIPIGAAVVAVAIAAFVSLLFVCFSCHADSAESASGQPAAASGADGEIGAWLQLDWTGGLRPASEHLTIYADGEVRLVLGSPRANGYIGTFELRLPKARFAELKQAVKEANLRSMKDEYGPWHLQADYTHVTITVNDELGTKQVRAHSVSLWYPRPLRRLFDLTYEHEGPYAGGVLSRLIDEVSTRPVAAIGVRIEVPKRPIRAGEPFNADIAVRNVATQPVVLPSPRASEIARSTIYVILWHVPTPAAELGSGLARTEIESTPPSRRYRSTLDDVGAADLGHVVRLEPGQEWRIRMPDALVAPGPGNYELIGQFWVGGLYDSRIVSAKLGATFVSGWTRPEPLTITAVK